MKYPFNYQSFNVLYTSYKESEDNLEYVQNLVQKNTVVGILREFLDRMYGYYAQKGLQKGVRIEVKFSWKIKDIEGEADFYDLFSNVDYSALPFYLFNHPDLGFLAESKKVKIILSGKNFFLAFQNINLPKTSDYKNYNPDTKEFFVWLKPTMFIKTYVAFGMLPDVCKKYFSLPNEFIQIFKK